MAEGKLIEQGYIVRNDLKKAMQDAANWQMAIYLTQDFEMDLTNLVIELERDPNGILDDFVVRFKSPFENTRQYIESISGEFVYWFDKSSVLKPLEAELISQRLIKPFEPKIDYGNQNVDLLISELARYFDCLTILQEHYLLVYFAPISVEDETAYIQFFDTILSKGIPPKVKFIVTDTYQRELFRKIIQKHSEKVRVIESKLDIVNAIKEAVKPTGNPEKPENKYRISLQAMMEAAAAGNETGIEKALSPFLQSVHQLNDPNIALSSNLLIGQAYFFVKNLTKTHVYADKLRVECEQKKLSDPIVYGVWNAGMLFKAAAFIYEKENQEALKIYDKVTVQALDNQHIFNALEGFRMQSYLAYQQGKIDLAWEKGLLGLTSAEYLPKDQQKQFSTLFMGVLVSKIAQNYKPKATQIEVDENLVEMLGHNWQKEIKGTAFIID